VDLLEKLYVEHKKLILISVFEYSFSESLRQKTSDFSREKIHFLWKFPISD